MGLNELKRQLAECRKLLAKRKARKDSRFEIEAVRCLVKYFERRVREES